jgi:hypothetical protein
MVTVLRFIDQTTRKMQAAGLSEKPFLPCLKTVLEICG